MIVPAAALTHTSVSTLTPVPPSLTLLVRLTGLTGAGVGEPEPIGVADPDADPGACWEAASAGSEVGPEAQADSRLVNSAATVMPASADALLDRTQTPQLSQ